MKAAFHRHVAGRGERQLAVVTGLQHHHHQHQNCVQYNAPFRKISNFAQCGRFALIL